jgi:hypothetical protein
VRNLTPQERAAERRRLQKEEAKLLAELAKKKAALAQIDKALSNRAGRSRLSANH